MLLTEFLDHVGFESWSKYPEEEFDLADDSKWEVHNHHHHHLLHVLCVISIVA
jgi:hypothetical protein